MAETVLLVGCGGMGRAMLTGWMGADAPPEALVVEPDAGLREAAAELGAKVFADADALPGSVKPDMVVLAVKPQVMRAVLPAYARFDKACFVSIAAGVRMRTLAADLADGAPLIRCMPNTPAAIGEGMMVCVGSDAVTREMKALATRLLTTSGEVAWIDDEGLMDAVTAVSGSGPAYVFHMIECLRDAGVDAGLPEELAGRLALKTVQGAGALALRSGEDPAILREQVTSPGGTTAAALSVLRGEGALAALMREAVEAARRRGAELGAD